MQNRISYQKIHMQGHVQACTHIYRGKVIDPQMYFKKTATIETTEIRKSKC